ncbi:DUF3103 family protein [Kribbella turkmenica]|uniref:DUF3103 family protein n=1 Tax=Kribbella turkmenica TaxID=2530375 RepID=UPI0014047F85|nr:DUF3103 family protein [Kribbella turkmenica]
MAFATAKSLASPTWRNAVVQSVVTGQQVDLEATAAQFGQSTLASNLDGANNEALALKGLPSSVGSLLVMRLADPAMATALKAGTLPLVAVPADDDSGTSSVVSYDTTGREVKLPRYTRPTQPVIMIDVDVAKAMAAGADLMNKTLVEGGHGTAAATDIGTADAIPTTKITEIRLNNDHDPWFKGNSEIYTIVGGVGKDNKAKATIVKMPYLNDEKHTYKPNQILIWWNNYKYNAVDAVMMEDDGDTNYLALAQEINKGLAGVTDKWTEYAPLVDNIMKAIPNKWWTDDPDHVEQWYTLQKNTTGQQNGASGNGWMKVVPFLVDEL